MTKPSASIKVATLRDVAREAGVSLITASRALGNPGLVSDKTIAKVQQAVAATGYLPNLLAGGLKSRRSHTVAGIIPALAVAQFLPTLQTLTETLAQAGYQLILGQTGYDQAREDALITTMISRRPDGLVMMGLVRSPEARERLAQAGLPVVETWDLSEHPVDMVVGFSHAQVGAAVAGYFRQKGWQRVGIATGDDHRAQLRSRAFREAWGGAVPTVVVSAASTLQKGRQALADLLVQDPQLQAVCCSSDQMAQGVITEALERGLRVPQDLAVCGFGNAEFSAHMAPSLTTVNVDGPAIGRLAARLILDRWEGREGGARTVDVGFQIVERQSTQAA